MAPSVAWIFSTTVPEESSSATGAKAVGGLLAREDGGLEGGAGAGAGLSLDDLDVAGGAADLGPVGDGTGEDALELLGGEVVDVDVGVHDRAHADDGDGVVLKLGDSVGVQLLLGEDVGAADLQPCRP